MKKLREKKLMKTLSTVQDLADGLMALADIRHGKGSPSGQLLVSSAGLQSAIISTHKNWVSRLFWCPNVTRHDCEKSGCLSRLSIRELGLRT
ncbi:hypothetical protein SLA2020_196670 [Shorea laevis]